MAIDQIRDLAAHPRRGALDSPLAWLLPVALILSVPLLAICGVAGLEASGLQFAIAFSPVALLCMLFVRRVVALIVGAVLLVIGASMCVRTLQFLTTAESVAAITGSGQSVQFWTIREELTQIPFDTFSGQRLPEDGDVLVRYDPTNPNNAQRDLPLSLWGWGGITGILGLGASAIGLGRVLQERKGAHRRVT